MTSLKGLLSLLLFNLLLTLPVCGGQISSDPTDQQLVHWLMVNVSPKTGLPYSFQVPDDKKTEIYKRMGAADSLTGMVERLIVDKGISVYDAALWQIVLTLEGGAENLARVRKLVEIYWQGSFGQLDTIRAGWVRQPFVYDPFNPEAVHSDLGRTGARGFLFRIINADGEYNMADPLDGRTRFETFPNSPAIHWEDWKPIAGENAWVVMAALHLHHRQNYDAETGQYKNNSFIELRLAEEIARAAILLQSETGGIRMAPLGTYFHLLSIDPASAMEDIARQLDDFAILVRENDPAIVGRTRYVAGADYPEYHSWYYDEISTENNLSWYAALRMLYGITGKEMYRNAMLKIEEYFKRVWDKNDGYFYQGMHFKDGEWEPNTEFYATDVQNWSICVLGPQTLDDWFGEGAAYRIWQSVKEISGSRNRDGSLAGVGFTREHNRVCIEWTGGAILAVRILSDYYRRDSPTRSLELEREARSMRESIEQFRMKLDNKTAAYSYSSRRDWIPFGWFSHERGVLSLASTTWVLLVDADFNPFFLPIVSGTVKPR